jgi:hypothetical protein
LQVEPIDVSQLEREGAFHAPVLEVARGAWFCSNAECVLHVRPGEPHVFGAGEWAVRPDGVVTSRKLVGGQMLCDVCGRDGGLFSTGDRT